MDFDSHTDDVVAATVALVNVLTPGWAHGREVTGDAGPAEVHAVLQLAARAEPAPPDGDQIVELTAYVAGLREVFELLDARDLDAACARVNDLLTWTAARPVLTRHDDGPWHLHFHPADAPMARGWVAGMATALAVALGNPAQDRLGVCSAPACDRVYLDTSRNGTRRFCSTACQNRVKTAALRERRAATVGRPAALARGESP